MPEDSDIAFPNGRYVCILGKIHPKWNDEKGGIESVMQEVWVAKFLGTPDDPKNEPRIAIKNEEAKLKKRGIRHLEFFPSPVLRPNMAWKAKAFYGKLNALQEAPPNEEGKRPKLVNWHVVASQYGRIFLCNMVYKEWKGRSFRNIDYDSIDLEDVRTISPDHMNLIEEEYKRMTEESKAPEAKDTKPDTNLDDIPF